MIIIGGEEDTHPDEVRLFKNRSNMTFDDAKAEPDQKFSLGKVFNIFFSSTATLKLHIWVK